jgi:hypothetical protein
MGNCFCSAAADNLLLDAHACNRHDSHEERDAYLVNGRRHKIQFQKEFKNVVFMQEVADRKISYAPFSELRLQICSQNLCWSALSYVYTPQDVVKL